MSSILYNPERHFPKVDDRPLSLTSVEINIESLVVVSAFYCPQDSCDFPNCMFVLL